MAKTKSARGGQPFSDPRLPIRSQVAKPKKERPASKGRVHKGRTRD